jgi:hypothetical protein
MTSGMNLDTSSFRSQVEAWLLMISVIFRRICKNRNGVHMTNKLREIQASLKHEISSELSPVWFGLLEHSKCASLDWAASWWTQCRTDVACSYRWSWQQQVPQ